MVRMLAGVTPAQTIYRPQVADYIRSESSLMLALAKRHLLRFSFFGIMVTPPFSNLSHVENFLFRRGSMTPWT